MSNKLSAAAAWMLQACWPQICFVCGAEAGATAVCGYCEPGLPWLVEPLCPSCALPTPTGMLCGRCLQRQANFDQTLAVFAYATPIREMVLALKHGQGFAQAQWLGRLLAERLAALSVMPDLLVPMPLHRTRLAERGFNQSAELAKSLHAVAQIPLALDLLVRDINTPRLEGLRQKARQQAVHGAFRCRESLAGAHVLVVDDVMTSGATLNELARTLKFSGAARVSNLVVARTLRRIAK